MQCCDTPELSLCCGKIFFLPFRVWKLRKFDCLSLAWDWMEGDEHLSHQPKSFQCSVRGLYYCKVSCYHQLARKAWVLTILARFRYQAPEMKQRSLQSVASKSIWIMPSYSTILSWKWGGFLQRIKYHELWRAVGRRIFALPDKT